MTLRRWPRNVSLRGARGAMTVEYGLVLLASLAFFAPAGEFFRLSFVDQTLARATHEAARAAASDPANCDTRIQRAFEADGAARWLFDLNDDGDIGIVPGEDTWPDNSAASEVQVGVSWDGDLSDGITWAGSGCGDSGSWIRVRSRIVVQPSFGPMRAWWGGIRREHVSWARNQG